MKLFRKNFLFFAFLLVNVWGACAAALRDVSWSSGVRGGVVVYRFNPAGGLPSYFQKYDASRGVLRVAFSNTTIPVHPGTWILQNNGSGLRALTLKNETSTRGVPLLVFEWAVGKDIQGDQNPVSLQKNGRFIMRLPTRAPKKAWSLLKASKTSPKIQPSIRVPITPIPSHATSTELPPQEMRKAMKNATLPPGLSEVTWFRGYGFEQFELRFPGTAPANYRFEDSMLIIPVKASRLLPAIPTGSSSIVKELRLVKAPLNSYEYQVRLRLGAPIQVLARGSRIWLQAPIPPQKALDVWSIQGKERGIQHSLFAQEMESEDLEDLEHFVQGATKSAPAHSQTFQLRKASHDLIVIEENVVLRESPSEVGKQLLQLKFGDRLQSLGLNNLYYKVKSGDVVGFVNRRMVSYPDELSHLQSERLQQLAMAQQQIQSAAKAAGITGGDEYSVEFDSPDEDRITYSSFGRRDPFIELKGVVNEGINIDGVELVGIIWEAEVPMVILTDSRNPGVSYTLKEGDSILNGKVLKITQDEVLFLINEYGVSRRYTMTLPDKYGGKK